jgi:hypothetical protein
MSATIHQCTVMLSDKYLWLVPELTPVHKAYELALFREPVSSKLAKEICQEANIDQNISTAYHPQTDGQSE